MPVLAIKLGTLPVPEVGPPIFVLSLVHVKVVPVMVLENVTAVVAVPLHTV